MEAAKRKEYLENRLKDYYGQIWIRGELCFKKVNGEIFMVSVFPGRKSIVVEFAENMDEALLNRYEDGDRFYLEEMDEETMFRAVMEEIDPENSTQVGLSLYMLAEVVENLKEYADHLLSKGRKNMDLVQKGQLIGIAEALQILRENVPEELIKTVGLDFDVEGKYLY